MTKMIKVTCPSCKTALSLPEQQLKETEGRADCHHCGHVFRLVKKKKAAEPAPTPTPKERVKPEPFFADVGTNDPIFPTDDFPTGNNKSSIFDKAKAATQSKKKTATKLNYREPKAKGNNAFADIGQKPFAFNMLDANSANSQIPQVSIKPAVNGNNPSISTGSPDQQNNITIHTDSLVFTLVGDNANDGGVIDAGGNKSNAPIVVSSGNDLNWTIATIAALIVLIVQLFYFVLMWQ